MYPSARRSSLLTILLGTWLGAAALAAEPTEPPVFVNTAIQSGMMEIEASQVAMSASTSTAVKTLADRISTDHQKANAELAVIARKKGIAVPEKLDEERTKMMRALRDKSIKEFDAAYVEQMVRDHAAAVELFRFNTRSIDPELAAFATRTLPVLEEHRRLATDLKAGLE